MSDTVLVPGARDVRGTLDYAAESGGAADNNAADTDEPSPADAVVVACPPHPRQRGHRGDERLRAVSDALGERGVDCLRFDYGDWDEGYGECTDADNAVGWALSRYERVGLFGFSFGGCVALVTAATRPALAGVCALAPTARIGADVDAVEALRDLADRGASVHVVYGTRDSTAEWQPVVERARELGFGTTELEADHFFVGRTRDAADAVVDYLAPALEG